MHILIVEDEPKLAQALQKGLMEEGYAVDVSYDGEDGLYWARTKDYDLIILDLMIPGIPGLEILERLRAEGRSVPVLILTARDAVADRVKGLDSGADDYLTKPFSFEELLARVRALLRRATAPPELQPLQVADLELDPRTRTVRRAGRPIELSPKEFALLEYFMRNPNRVLSRTVLSEHVWGEFDTLTNVIDVYIHHLRGKIDKDAPMKLIHTVRGAGYVLKVPERDEDTPKAA
jgi:heavy metal response regulator